MRCSDVVIRPVRYSILDRALSHFYSHFYQATNSYRYCCSGNQWKRESVTEMIRFPVVYYLHLECVASKLDNPLPWFSSYKRPFLAPVGVTFWQKIDIGSPSFFCKYCMRLIIWFQIWESFDSFILCLYMTGRARVALSSRTDSSLPISRQNSTILFVRCFLIYWGINLY
jgi:hypothetical protein